MLIGQNVPDRGHPDHDNRDAMIRFGLCMAVAFLFASAAPSGLLAAVMSALLVIGAMATASLAALLGEEPFVDHFTRWDEVAALLLISMIIGLLVDPAAIEAISKAQQIHQQLQ